MSAIRNLIIMQSIFLFNYSLRILIDITLIEEQNLFIVVYLSYTYYKVICSMYAVLCIHKSATSNMYTYLHIIVLFLVVGSKTLYRVPAIFVLENRVKNKTSSV